MQAKVLIGTNVLTAVDSAVYANHIQFYVTTARNKDIKLIQCAPGRMSIDRMRNMCAKIALENECTHILFLDDDVLVNKDVLTSLIETDLDIVMAHTYIRGYPFHPMSFIQDESRKPGYHLNYFDDIEEKAVNGVARCEAVGFSCCLIKTWIFNELEAPYFCTTPNSTEDVYFCMRCKNDIQGREIEPGIFEGKEVKIGVDLRVPTGHLMEREPVSVFNAQALKDLHENGIKAKIFKGTEVNPENANRANGYLSEVEKLTQGVAQ